MLRVSEGPRQLQAAVGVVGQLPKQLRDELRDETRARALPLIRAAAMRRAGSDPRRRAVAATARYSPYRDVPGVAFGGARVVLADGQVKGRTIARATEFGSPGTRRVRLRVRSPKGTTYTVTRHTTANWRPAVTGGGAWVYPAAFDVAEPIMREWIATVERLTVRAFGGV